LFFPEGRVEFRSILSTRFVRSLVWLAYGLLMGVVFGWFLRGYAC
jgi:hypothetical protein